MRKTTPARTLPAHISGSLKHLRRLARVWRQTLHLMVGVPDYDNYVAQQRRYNPNAPVMTRRHFLDYCANRRLGGKNGGRCC